MDTQKEFIKIVDEIILKANSGMNFKEEEKILNQKVYSLYGISDDEIKTIEQYE